MGITVRYRLPDLHPLSTDEARCLELMELAVALARPVLDDFQIPYREVFIDERHRDKSYRRFCRQLELSGSAQGSEELGYGWSWFDLQWSNHDFCKTHAAIDFTHTHIAVAEVVALWHHEGLITEYRDDGEWLPHRDRDHLLRRKALDSAGIGAVQDMLQDLQVPHHGVAPGGVASTWNPPSPS